MLNRAACYLLAAIEAIIGWEWFISGSNKVLWYRRYKGTWRGGNSGGNAETGGSFLNVISL